MSDMNRYQLENTPCSFVIFGAASDLASSKLLPALFNLEIVGRLTDNFSIVAFSRRDRTVNDWREHVREIIVDKVGGQPDESVLERFLKRFRYQQGDLNDVESYRALAKNLFKVF